VVVEVVEVATLRVVEVVTLVEAEVGEVEVVVVVVVVEVAHLGGHQEAFLEVSQGDSPLEEVVIHLETKGCWVQHQKYSMEAGRTFTTSYSHSVSIGR
jgi:hypothetical protein